MDALKRYISEKWPLTVRGTPLESVSEADRLIALPRPYTVPCTDTHFQELYYWDTYFAHRGLLLSGHLPIVLDNIENFIYLIDTYGFIPNGSHKSMLNRSQPPFFGLMLRDIYRETGDKAWLARAVTALQKEYAFWDGKRKSANGLNHYSSDADEARFARSVNMYAERTGILREGDSTYWGRNILAEAESGWDFCARFEGKCHEYNAVDLNALLWFDEKFLAFAARELGTGDGAEWEEKAAGRYAKMTEWMRGEDGIYYDYSYVEGKQSAVRSVASFFPYFVGMCDTDAGVDALLGALELPFGLQAAEPVAGAAFQWGDQNGWACLQLVAVEGLLQVGRRADALRLAQKFVHTVERTFAQTGKLFEKYNVREGNADAVSEYGTPEMMGWTAGTYLALKKFLTENG
ncbi:MAG: alpha,alpha-trehalase [Ruminococcaceae bacterium]|nr:alpha,alpha-trehalase [Oscillospiraceae bacterium]